MGARLLAAANHIAHNTFDAEGGLCKEAVSLLPEGSDAAVLINVVMQHLACIDAETLITLLE